MDRCAAMRARLTRPGATITHPETPVGSQPRSRAIDHPRRTFRSKVPISSLTSTISVLSSISNNDRRVAFHATRSTIPRSPKIENETSGVRLQSGSRSARCRATSSWRRECRALSSRSRSPARQRATRSTRISSAAEIRRIVSSDNEAQWPRSMLETVACETRLLAARSACLQPRRCRTARTTEPNRKSSINQPVWEAVLIGHVPLPGTPGGQGHQVQVGSDATATTKGGEGHAHRSPYAIEPTARGVS
jgi:hypothetical protein